MQIGQAAKHAFGDFSQNLFACPATELLDLFVHFVEAATLTKLHGNTDCARRSVHESTIVSANIFRAAVFVEVELAEDLFFYCGIWIRSDDLLKVNIHQGSTTVATYLQRENRLAVFEFTSGHSTASTLPEYIKLDDLILRSCSDPALIVQVFNV